MLSYLYHYFHRTIVDNVIPTTILFFVTSGAAIRCAGYRLWPTLHMVIDYRRISFLSPTVLECCLRILNFEDTWRTSATTRSTMYPVTRDMRVGMAENSVTYKTYTYCTVLYQGYEAQWLPVPSLCLIRWIVTCIKSVSKPHYVRNMTEWAGPD